ncbi:MAG: DUF1080 domain-containing protein [Dysgonamonadaceae bacterium]|jgi:hypothetical protein|nr:DUF1080 domain-containing protein [Dysgonamonadaceae bacterium]
MNCRFILPLLFVSFLTACAKPNEKVLFDGSSLDKWVKEGDVKIDNQILILTGEASQIVLKQGDYASFELSAQIRTTEYGKGFIGFHTDTKGNGGYRVAIDNDISNNEWWTKTGSLLSVRNLTKSLIGENEWFALKIRVEGKKISVKVNDEPVVEYIEPASPYRLPANAGQKLSKGLFTIKSTGSGAVEIKEITVSLLNNKNIDIAAQEAEATDETTDDIIKLHQANFPVLDYHVHLKENLSLELAKQQSRKFGINYALAPNCGIGFPITNDSGVIAYLDKMKEQPFVQAMQGEGREWPETFSKDVRDKFDYVFTDAMTFTDAKGRRTRLWMPDEVWVENEEEYMDLIVRKICDVMNEPMDVYVNPTFLPDAMNDRYDAFWTDTRQQKVIDAMVKAGKALEINARYEIPHKSFIQKAKAAGLKFTFGTNNSNADTGKLEYCIRMKNECNITAEDMFKPIRR